MYYPIIDRETIYENLHIYLLLFFVLLVLSIFIYIKLSFPFWNNQPVYHSYDFWRYLYTRPFIIQKRFPIKSRFCDFDNIETQEFVDISGTGVTELIDLLQCHYVSSDSTFFIFHKDNLNAYFVGHQYPCYFSFYRKPPPSINQTKYGTKNTTWKRVEEAHKKDDVIKGCVSSRPMEFSYNGEQHTIYFVDFICVNRELDKKDIMRRLLQTHDYRIRIREPIKISLLKKEGEPYHGVVPIIKHQSYVYDILKDVERPQLPLHFLIKEITYKNINILVDFIGTLRSKFSVFGITSLGNIVEMLKAKILFVFCVYRKEEIHGVYFFRDSRTQYEIMGKNGPLLHFFGSIQNSNSQQLFYDGFLHTLGAILKTTNVFRYLMIENISHNFLVLDFLDRKPFLEIDQFYYTLNYFIPKKLNPRTCLIIS